MSLCIFLNSSRKTIWNLLSVELSLDPKFLDKHRFDCQMGVTLLIILIFKVYKCAVSKYTVFP